MADTIAIENAVRGLHEFGQRVQRHRDAVRKMEQKRITSLSFDKIIATVDCPWCHSRRGVDCVDSRGGFKEVPHKSRFKAALNQLNSEESKGV